MGSFPDAPGISRVWRSIERSALAATSRRAELRRVYAEAVARGANNTGCTSGVERAYGTLLLLTLALMRVRDLALCAHPRDTVRERGKGPLVAACHERCSRRRFAARGPGARGPRARCRLSDPAWMDVALLHAAARLGCQAAADDDDVPVALDEARSAAGAAATAATFGDRMLVAEQLAVGWDI